MKLKHADHLPAIKDLCERGFSQSEIARRLKIPRVAVLRLIHEHLPEWKPECLLSTIERLRAEVAELREKLNSATISS